MSNQTFNGSVVADKVSKPRKIVVNLPVLFNFIKLDPDKQRSALVCLESIDDFSLSQAIALVQSQQVIPFADDSEKKK